MYKELVEGIQSGKIVPYLGAGALKDVKNMQDGSPIPADSDSLILAMNNGQPMAPRLMYEFPRAAMNMENKKGRSFVQRFLNETYGEKEWTRGQLHDWIADLKPNYVIDVNRDTQLLDTYADCEHTLVMGVARITASDYRFKLFHYDGSSYSEVQLDQVNPSLPIVFKPLGAPKPEANYIAADADFVDYITELMGGFAIPDFLKDYRKEKQYLFLGMRFTRDTERMVMSDIIYAADEPAGWAFIPEPTDKERRFCALKKIEIIEQDWDVLLSPETAQAMA
ncbi:SIR2 family protein [Marinobacterium litorale]|uniref:SIR2 family protein n=1 Tax=Marinobacterium litorale TaxID=404770 RepID=UPI0003F60656|nr:SIR2 family protein [Marinobacterium litorale]